ERLAHRLAIMHEGRIAVAGSLADVLSRYRARIDFRVSAWNGERPATLPALPDLTGEVDPDRLAEGRVQIDTSDLQKDLETVLGWARTHALKLHSLSAR